MEPGCKIRLQLYTMGKPSHQGDFVVEKFRHCLGVFLSDEAREAGHFTPLCDLYEPGPESEERYISNYGGYHTNMVPAWMDLPPASEPPNTEG